MHPQIGVRGIRGCEHEARTVWRDPRLPIPAWRHPHRRLQSLAIDPHRRSTTAPSPVDEPPVVGDCKIRCPAELHRDTLDDWNRGAQRKYSDLAIEAALTLRLLFHLPLRQAEGFLSSLFGLMGLDLRSPDHTTLSRRGQHLDLSLRAVPRRAGLQLIIDSTGLSIVGEGEWAAAKHGGRGTRGWKKLHVWVDPTGVIVAQALTDATGDDATTGVALIEAVNGPLTRVTADGAYDTVAFYDAAGARGARVVVPPTKTARVSRRRPQSSARDRTITTVQRIGRHRWKKTARGASMSPRGCW